MKSAMSFRRDAHRAGHSLPHRGCTCTTLPFPRPATNHVPTPSTVRWLISSRRVAHSAARPGMKKSGTCSGPCWRRSRRRGTRHDPAPTPVHIADASSSRSSVDKMAARIEQLGMAQISVHTRTKGRPPEGHLAVVSARRARVGRKNSGLLHDRLW